MLSEMPAPSPPCGSWQLKTRRSGVGVQGSGLQVSLGRQSGFLRRRLGTWNLAEMVRKASIRLACSEELSSGYCMMHAWCCIQCASLSPLLTALLHAQQCEGWVLLPAPKGAPSWGSSFQTTSETLLSILAVALLLQGGCQVPLPDTDPQGSGPVIELCPRDWPPSRATFLSLRPSNSRGPTPECQVNPGI